MSGIRSSFGADVSALKDIPGYKAILKTVLKSQIQLLIEQLAENTGEESIILTASINDGSLSHLGSNMGKSFLDGREEIKSQFLGFCLKGHHQNKQGEDTLRHSNPMFMSHMPPRRPRIRAHPYALSPPQSHSTPSNRRHPSQDLNNTNSTFIKPEDNSSNSVDNFLDSVATNNQQENNHPVTFPSSINLSHTQTSNHSEDKDINLLEQSGDNEDQSNVRIKVEQGLDEHGDEGVAIMESADTSATSDNWFQNSNDTDQQGFSDKDDKDETVDPADKSMENIGGVAFPGLENSHHDFRSLPELSQTELKQVLYPDNKSFMDTSMFDMHLQSGMFPGYSPPVRARMSTPRKGGQYWCNTCNKLLQNKALYEYHLRAHNGVKPYECKLCFRKFAGKQVLETHMRLHSGEKPFKCTIPGCDRAFSARSGLDYHIRKHHPPQALLDPNSGNTQ